MVFSSRVCQSGHFTFTQTIRTDLGTESEDGHVSTVGKDDVGQGSDDVLEVWVLRPSMPVDLLSVLDQNRWILYSGADDGDEGCGQDTQERDEGP